jgi:hypothetical protein
VVVAEASVDRAGEVVGAALGLGPAASLGITRRAFVAVATNGIRIPAQRLVLRALVAVPLERRAVGLWQTARQLVRRRADLLLALDNVCVMPQCQAGRAGKSGIAAFLPRVATGQGVIQHVAEVIFAQHLLGI